MNAPTNNPLLVQTSTRSTRSRGPAEFGLLPPYRRPSPHMASADAAPDPAAAAASTSTLPDTSYAPVTFHGRTDEDIESWLAYFEKYAAYRALNDGGKLALISLLLRDSALDFYDGLAAAKKGSYAALKKSLEDRYKPSELLRWQDAACVWTRVQGAEEKCDAYVSVMLKLAKRVPIAADDKQLLYAVMKGLKPSIRAYVMQQSCKTMEELQTAARIAELSSTPTDAAITALADQQQRNADEMREIMRKVGSLVVHSVDQGSAAGDRRSPTPPQTSNRRVRFQSPSSRMSPTTTPTPPPRRQQQQRHQQQRRLNNYRWNNQHGNATPCGQCGKPRLSNHRCPAFNLTCFTCGKRGHLSAVCRTGRRSQTGNRP